MSLVEILKTRSVIIQIKVVGQCFFSLPQGDERITMHVMFYRLAIKQLSEIDGWSMDQMKAIIERTKTVWKQAVNIWDKDQVNELGKVLSTFHHYTSKNFCQK